jgi:pyruvate/2-oxoglutarate dehydrogenase complex dihydrolipoamide dehydrogenase (E3) component
MREFDVVVVGAGGAGLAASFTASGLGAKTAIIEAEKTGGECTWSGCIPSKALINFSHEIHEAKGFSKVPFMGKEAMGRVSSVIHDVYSEEDPETLESKGITVISGWGIFKDQHTIVVNQEEIKAKKFILATGSSPFVPPIPGLDQVPFLTNESFFKLEELPKSIIVLGGGPIGSELSQAMNRLGVKVTTVEMMPTIMGREEPELVKILSEKMIEEGVDLRTGSKAVKVTGSAGAIELTVEKEGKSEVLKAEAILVAIGRKPRTSGMGLEEIGVKLNPRGFVGVNKKLRTSVKNIYACGDNVGPYQLSHMAGYQGPIAARNAVMMGLLHVKVDYTHIPWVTFTSPEFGHSGMTEAQAKEKYGNKVRVFKYDYHHLDRAKTKPGSIGVAKIIVGPGSKLLGAHVLGDRAGEILSELHTIKALGIPFHKIYGVIKPYPVYSDIIRKLARDVSIDNIINNPIVKLFRKKK